MLTTILSKYIFFSHGTFKQIVITIVNCNFYKTFIITFRETTYLRLRKYISLYLIPDKQ